MTNPPPTLLILGPSGHGVTEYSQDVAAAVRSLDHRTSVVATRTMSDAVGIARRHPSIHLHITDRLLGASPEEAAHSLEILASATRLTITAHDLPQASDGTGLSRRIAAYRRMFAAAHAAVVNSAHEVLLVREYLPGAPDPHAIPLGSRAPVAPPRSERASEHAADGRDLVVLVAGFVYPGKGHTAAIRAASSAADELRAEGATVGRVIVRAIGGPSPGHEADLAQLRAKAVALDVSLEVTGYLDPATFRRRIVEDGIPLAAHEHVSASRSMLDWVEAGRRVLVVDSRYAAEMERLRPETMIRYEPRDLAMQIARSWRRPQRTWLRPGVSLVPTLEDTARAYLDWWNGRWPQ
jgi:hypothetical protein